MTCKDRCFRPGGGEARFNSSLSCENILGGFSTPSPPAFGLARWEAVAPLSTEADLLSFRGSGVREKLRLRGTSIERDFLELVEDCEESLREAVGAVSCEIDSDWCSVFASEAIRELDIEEHDEEADDDVDD